MLLKYLAVIVILTVGGVFSWRTPLVQVSYPAFEAIPSQLIYFVAENGEDPMSFQIICTPLSAYDFVETASNYYYYWTKNGLPFHWSEERNITTNAGQLIFHDPQDEDAGVYRCHVLNEYGLASSQEIHIQKWIFDEFEDTSPKTIAVHLGDIVKLACNAPHTFPKADISWRTYNAGVIGFTDTKSVHVDSNGDLWITNIVNSSLTSYICIVTVNQILIPGTIPHPIIKFGAINHLKLNETDNEQPIAKPQLLLASNNTFTEVDSELILVCIFDGKPQITWFKNVKNAGLKQKYLRSNMLKLVTRVRDIHFGRYTCQASNSAGTAEHHFDVIPGRKPKFLNYRYFSISELTLTDVGETKIINLNATGKPEPKVEWFYNGRPISEAPVNKRRTINGTEITIVDIQPSDAFGVYGCKISNELGHAYKELSFVVITRPLIQTPPDPPAVGVIGKNYTLPCATLGSSKPKVQWFLNGTELANLNTFKIQESGALFIKNVTALHAGEFMCRATNIYGSDSQRFKFAALEPIQIVTPTRYIVAREGFYARLRCDIRVPNHDALDAQPNVNWFHNGELIASSYSSSTFQINDVKRKHAGIYNCQAKTQYEVVMSTPITVIVESKEFDYGTDYEV